MVNLVAQCVRHFYNSLLKKSVSTNNNRMSAAPCAATAQTNHEAAQLYAPLCSPKVIRPIKWRMGCVGERRGAYRVLVCKPEGRSPLGRPRHRCEDNITMYLQEIGWYGVNWIDLPQDRNRWWAVLSAVMNLRVP